MKPANPVQDFLENLPDLSQRIGDTEAASQFSLDSITTYLAALGNPQERLKTLHIAGSNGKGSVLAFCAAALQVQAYKVGTFTSPHLGDPLQGIRINGRRIPTEVADSLLPQLEEARKSVPDLTLFEAQTALAFLYFAQQQVDIALIETGLGGSFDATNVVHPLATLITPIDLEHQPILGPTLSDIAAHKAGIIKPNTPLILARQPEAARAVILTRARKQSAPVLELGREFSVERTAFDLSGQRLSLTFDQSQSNLFISALGSYQVENAALAYAALKTLHQLGLPVSDEAIASGFAATTWPGRFEIIQLEQRYVLDAAHTPAAAAHLSQSLKDFFANEPLLAVLGLSNDKQLNPILAALDGQIAELVLTQSSHPRALSPSQMLPPAASLGYSPHLAPDLDQALSAAADLAQPGQSILIFGSVFLVEEARALLTGDHT